MKSMITKRSSLGVAGVSLAAMSLLGGCGEAIIEQGTTASHGIEDCGNTWATDNTNRIISPTDYPGMVRTAKREATVLHARAQQNDGYIDLSYNQANGNALISTSDNLNVSWNYDSHVGFTIGGNGYAVDIQFEQGKPEINLGILACNDGSKIYQTVFYQQLGTYVSQSASFPSR